MICSNSTSFATFPVSDAPRFRYRVGLRLYRKGSVVYKLDESGLVAWKTVRPIDHDLRLHGLEIPKRGEVLLPEPPILVPLTRKNDKVFYFGTLKVVIRQKLTGDVARRVYNITPIPSYISLKNHAGQTWRKVVKLNAGLRGIKYFNVIAHRSAKAPRR